MKFIITAILISLSNFTYALSYTLEFSEVELQAMIEKMMPLEKKYFVSVIFSDPELDLLEKSNQLSIKTHISADVPGSAKGTGMAKISGSIAYKPEHGSFHLLKPKVIELQIDGVLAEHQPAIKEVAQLAITNAMANFPLYTLDEKDLQQKYAKSVLESVRVQDGKLFLTLNVM